MSTEVALSRTGSCDRVTEEMVAEYLKTFGQASKLTDLETRQFVKMAIIHNLNPFKREIYCVPYGKNDNRKLSIITGYETYLKRAERSRSLDGWRSWTEGKLVREESVVKMSGPRGSWDKPVVKWGGNLKACVEIRRKDRSHPFYHEVLFTEYAQDTEMWRSKPTTMIKKVAIAQAFRMCFPDEFCGMLYTADELPDEMVGVSPIITNEPSQDQITDSQPEVSHQNSSRTSIESIYEDTPQQAPSQAQKLERHPYWVEKTQELKNIFESVEDGKPIFEPLEIKLYKSRWANVGSLSQDKTQDAVDAFVKEIKEELAERVSRTPEQKAFVEIFDGTVEAITVEEEISDTNPAVGECGRQELGYF